VNVSTACRFVAATALLLLLLDGPLPDADGKARKVACKAGQVAVKLGKKTACRPFSKVFPKPRATDSRLAVLREALKFDPAKAVRGKRRKRARTLQSGFGAAGRRAQKKLLRLAPKALAFVDRKRMRAVFSRLSGPAAATASAGCEAGPAGPTGHTGGGSIGALGDNGLYVDVPAGGGLRVRLTFVDCRGTTFRHIPECPTADGGADAEGSGQFRATIEIWDGGTLVSRNSSTFEDRTKAHGQVGADAKLKFIDVEHTQEAFIVASGGIVIRGGVTRKVRIDMPGGSYDPARASVRYFGDKVSDDSGAQAFAGTAAAALGGYQASEARWSSFDSGANCAEPVFSPASNTLKLRKNDSKQVSVFAKARADGGRASEARWTLQGQENAEFSPASSDAAAPAVTYRVTNAPPNGLVRVTVKFTSTAGVGKGTWTQPTEEAPTINEVSGTFSQVTVQHFEQGDSVLEFAGNVTFERFTPAISGGAAGLYKFKSGSVSVTASGNGAMFAAAPLCSQQGSMQLSFSAEGTQFFVLGMGPDEGAPYQYSFELFSNTNPEPPKLPLQIYACDEAAQEQEGIYPIPIFFGMFGKGAHESTDGVTYADSEIEEAPAVTVTETWSFTGTE
jgi:hypothetical protein